MFSEYARGYRHICSASEESCQVGVVTQKWLVQKGNSIALFILFKKENTLFFFLTTVY